MNLQFRAFVAAALLLAPAAFAQSTTKISVSAGGTAGNADSGLGTSTDSVTPDGRFCVFYSLASNLVAGDSGSAPDVFLRDNFTGTISRVSETSGGVEANGGSSFAALSDDGRFVAFDSVATNLAVGDFNGTIDIFVRDGLTGLVSIVSVSDSGAIGNGPSSNPSISADGTLVAFESEATNLVVADTNATRDVFVHNRATHTTRLVSRIPGGALGNAESRNPALSGDGRFVAFESQATNLVPGAVSLQEKILVVDLTSGGPQLVSVNDAGVSANARAIGASISRDGSRVAFLSYATNLESTGTSADKAFLRDRVAGTTTVIHQLANGTPSNGVARAVHLSDNGNFASLISTTTDLTPGHLVPIPDAFVIDLSSHAALRASVPLSLPGDPNGSGVLTIGTVSDDGRRMTFQTSATNVLAGEPIDLTMDVYLRDLLATWYRDVDGDLYGDTANSIAAVFPPSVGYVLIPGDCDDANAAIHPGAIEACNGVDDDCDGEIDELAWNTYCTAATSVAGCVPTMSAIGFPNASGTSGFSIQSAGLPGGRHAIAIYGLAPASVAYAIGSTSVLCFAAPRQRTLNLPTGGTAGLCDGSYSLDWLAWMSAYPAVLGQPLQPGQTIYSQVWYRDPGAVLNSNLTGGVAFTLCP